VCADDDPLPRRLAVAGRCIVPFNWVPGIIWFILKSSMVFFMFAMAKAFVPRYRYDQLMRLGWKVFPAAVARHGLHCCSHAETGGVGLMPMSRFAKSAGASQAGMFGG
jgi:hypothetical protein